jgi:hypothetical protein
VPSALSVSSAPDGSVSCVPSVPADIAVTEYVSSGSVSAPKPLSANTFPAVITVFSVVKKASLCATAAGVVVSMVTAWLSVAPTLAAASITRAW